VDALLFLRRFVVLGHDLERRKILSERTLWLDQPKLTFELHAALDNTTFIYRLVIDSHREPERARVVSETVTSNKKPIFEFQNGEVRLFDDRFQHTVTYPFDRHRSALATLTEMKDNRRLAQFKQWFSHLFCFRINPFRIKPLAEREDAYPYFDLSNFSAWYRHLIQSSPQENAKLMEDLESVLDDFKFLKLERIGENSRELFAEFAKGVKLGLGRLSDGQRCLICLYSILHFVLSKGGTVLLDEPENFISLREMQPWLNAVSNELDANRGQIIMISHHPEFMNQWAPDFGIQFIREGINPVRVRKFSGERYATLLPSEIIARGWENE